MNALNFRNIYFVYLELLCIKFFVRVDTTTRYTSNHTYTLNSEKRLSYINAETVAAAATVAKTAGNTAYAVLSNTVLGS